MAVNLAAYFKRMCITASWEGTCKTEKNIFIHNKSVSLHVHIYRDIRDPTIKLFL